MEYLQPSRPRFPLPLPRHPRSRSRAVPRPRPRQPQTLPEILSREEVWRLLNACTRIRDRLLLATTYTAGLRVSEVVHLKVADLDADRMTVRIAPGKGAVDRYVPLSPRLLKDWRAYWQTTPPQQ